mmetsp:Transcript_11780/g.25715  ORF Transcript_11780/g.25715 Transcript_11780/m.25715 type:complete len:725 (+) Transcript_11780:2-2176(+)
MAPVKLLTIVIILLGAAIFYGDRRMVARSILIPTVDDHKSRGKNFRGNGTTPSYANLRRGHFLQDGRGDRGRSRAEMFQGAANFLQSLRQRYAKKKLRPQPHCNVTSTGLRFFNRGIQYHFVGKNVSAVEQSFGPPEDAACNFVAMQFNVSKQRLDAELTKRTYLSAFKTTGQCGELGGDSSAFDWDPEMPLTCLGNNFGGMLGPANLQECRKVSPGGSLVERWLEKNLNGDAPLTCLKKHIEIAGQNDVVDLTAIENAASRRAQDGSRLRKEMQDGCLKKGFGSNQNWYEQLYTIWIGSVISGSTPDLEAAARILSDLSGVVDDPTLASCVEGLMPSLSENADHNSTDYLLWKKWGFQILPSTMTDSPTSLLRSFSDSLGGVLPPPPTMIYGRNAAVGQMVNVKNEAYFPGCTAWWNACTGLKNSLAAFKDVKATELFPEWKGQMGRETLREETLDLCAKDEERCPFPVYEIVIQLHQCYCNAFFHFSIEIWPRIAPFLETLLSDDVPQFAIRIGCPKNEGGYSLFHQYFSLYGLNGTRGFEILPHDSTVFAKEVLMPTEGFSHSPLLNYWGLVSAREAVHRRIRPRRHLSEKKVVLVIIRDSSRRGDGDVFNQYFLEVLAKGLQDKYEIRPYKSSDKNLMACLECQVKEFMSADVVIGSHGAGLSLVLFAKTGATVIERIVQLGDSAIYAELPFIMGMKYFPLAANAPAEAYRDAILFADLA